MSFRVIAVSISVVIAAAIGCAAALLWGDAVYPGVRVAGVEVGGLSQAEAEAALPVLSDREIALRYPGGTVLAKLSELGASPDAEATALAAYRYGRKGSLVTRLRDVLKARRSGAEVPVVYRFDDSRHLSSLASKLNRPPVDARPVMASGAVSVSKEAAGLALDEAESLSRLVRAVQAGADSVELVMAEIEPKVRAADLKGIDGVIGTYATHFKPWERNRTHNLTLAVRMVNGILLRPGEVFSYNKTVGPRLEERGFRNAPIFVKGEVEPGMGGGVCQISTTIYNAALLADMKILARSHHSRPVAYAPVGRDATVAYPAIDLKFQNTTDSPVYIAISMSGNTVEASFFGKKQEGREVSLVRVEHRIIPPSEERKEVDNLTEPVVEKEGRPGHRASTYRVVRQGGVVVRRELISNDYYRPEKRVIAV
ncbi:MAG: VanW family protein, partial [Armatimonadota bacterium]